MTDIHSQLSTIYGNAPLEAIEMEISTYAIQAKDAVQGMVERLFYLDFSKRYREDPSYKKASFKSYIEGKLGISELQYQTWRTAYAQFPEEVKEHGVGFISETMKTCGSVRKAREALNRVSVQAHTRNKPLLHHEKKAVVEKFVQATAAPKKEPATPIIDWKGRYDELTEKYAMLLEEHHALEAKHKNALATIERIRTQLDKARSYQSAVVGSHQSPQAQTRANA